MRLYWWLPVLLASLLVIGNVPARAEDVKIKTKNNIVTVQPTYDDTESLPALLDNEDEVTKIQHLQQDKVNPSLASPISPDDQAVLISTDTQMGFLNINDGSIVELSAEALGPFVPLPFYGLSSFVWLDDQTLGCLALNYAANSQAEYVVALGINRATLEISVFYLVIPDDLSIVSISPDLTHFAAAVIPPEDSTSGGYRDQLLKTQVTLPQVGNIRQAGVISMPRAFQARAEQARTRFASLLDRFQFMQDTPTDETTVTKKTLDLVTYDALSGERNYVTTLPEATSLFGEAWAPDSSRLALSFFSLSEPDDARYSFDGALLSEIAYRDVTGNIPPAENPYLQENNTYVVDVNSHDVQILRAAGQGAPPLLSVETWAPDNATLLVKAWYPAKLKGRTYPIYSPQFTERSSYRFYTKDLQLTGELNTNILSAGYDNLSSVKFVTPDEIIFAGVVGSNRHPYYYNRVSGELRNLADRAGTYWGITNTNQSRQIVFLYTSFTQPDDIYRIGWDGHGFARLTWFNEELSQFANLRQDPVSFKLNNGQVRTGTLIQPSDAAFPPKNKPLVVWQEGGPGYPMLNQWGTNVESPYSLLPTFGFPVLVVPLSGRSGYTPATYNALADRANFGQIDIDEQAQIVRQMIARGWTNQSKVGITGCSYGGYFAWQSIIRYPTLYVAANPQCSLVDLLTEWTRGYASMSPYLEGLPPYSNQAEYRNDSPIYNADKIKAAVLSFQGSDDFLPEVQGENLHLLLYNRGLKARMIKFVSEGHGLADYDNQLYAAQEQLDWFRTYLKP
ncbi:MAG: prolyl oligopeptidase family serine peptidase [Oscillochloris sp.]|nr:prolyl oligopeptidase family serine peptidase [Oscillochloris sp.]